MKKKGFGLRRAVSMLLAVAMILTAAPQTGMTALAVGGGTDASQGIAADTDTTPASYEDGNGNGTNDAVTDQAGDEDDKKEGDIEDDDSSDQPEGEGDDQPTDPGDGDQGGDDADQGEGNNTEEPAEPGEGTDGDLLTEDESVSVNDVDALGADKPMAIDEEAPAYLGELKNEEDGSRLVFSEWEWNDKKEEWGEDAPGTFKAAVLAALDYYAEQGNRFDHVQIDEGYDSNKDSKSALTVSKDYINKVISVLPEDGEGEFYYSYGFNDGVNIGFSLWHPTKASKDYTATYKVEYMKWKGVKINLSNTDYPAEGLYVNWNGKTIESKDRPDSSLYFGLFWDTPYPLRLLSWDSKSNVPTGIVGTYEPDMDPVDWSNDVNPRIGFNVNEAMNPEFGDAFTAGKDYLITNMIGDTEYIPLGDQGTTIEVKGLKVSDKTSYSYGSSWKDAKWISLDGSVVFKPIDSGNKTQTNVTADKIGETYYVVTYDLGNNSDYGLLELHSIKAAIISGDDKLTYIGETGTDDDGSTRLRIDEREALNNETTVQKILNYYNSKSERFNCVQLDMFKDSNAPANMEITIGKEIFQSALGLLDSESNNYWMDYNVNFKDGKRIGYSLDRPKEMNGNEFKVACTVTPLINQGVKINLSRKDFPVNGGVYLDWSADDFDIGDYFWDTPDGNGWTRVLEWNGSEPANVLDIYNINFYDNGFGVSVGEAFGPRNEEDEQVLFEANRDYLVTSLRIDDEQAPLGEPIPLTAGERSGSETVSDVSWKVLSDGLISIGPDDDGTDMLEGIAVGDAYYWVKYQADGNGYSELHLVNVAAKAGNKMLGYIGDVERISSDDPEHPWEGDMLRISEQEAKEKNKGASINDILTYRRDYMDESFLCVELEIIDSAPKSRTMNKDYIRNACDLMAGVGDQQPWLNYGFVSRDGDGNEKTRISYSLQAPEKDKAKANIKATFTLTGLDNQGLKVKFATTAFPAERVSFDYDTHESGEYGKYAKCLPEEDDGESLRLFKHSSGTPTAMVATDQDQGYGGYDFYENDDGDVDGMHLNFNNIMPLGTTEYLAAHVYEAVYEDEGKPVVGQPKQLKAGISVDEESVLSSVTWKSFDTDKAAVDKNGVMTAWREYEDIYYYVKYKVGKVQYLEVYEAEAVSQDVRITIDADKVETDEDGSETRTITLKYYTPSTPAEIEEDRKHPDPEDKWLQVRYYPVTADRNDKRLKWEITEGKDRVISFVKSEEGNEVVGNGIVAVGPGEATVKVSYMDGDYDENENFIPKKNDSGKEIVLAEATCTIIVEQPLMWYDMQEKENKLDIYAVMDVDAELKDVTGLVEGWKWLDPSTKLAGYKGMDGCKFPAEYTDAESGRTYKTFLWVNFITPTGITMMAKNEAPEESDSEWSEWIPPYLVRGEDITFTYRYTFDGIDMEDPNQQDKIAAIQQELKDYYTNVEWTPPSKESFEEQGDEQGDEHKYIAKILGTGAKEKAEKKTFTVSVKNDKKKVIYKDTRNITVTLEPEYDFDNKVELVDPVNKIDDKGQRWLVVKVNADVDEYNNEKLTIASEDTSVLKLDAKKTVISDIENVNDISKGKHEDGGEDDTTYVKIPFTLVKPGTAWIKLTASDEMKTFRRYRIEFPDKEPKAVSPTAVTINKALVNEDDRTAMVRVRTHKDYPLVTEDIKFLVDNKENTADLNVTAGQTDEPNVYDITIKMPDGSALKKGNHTVTLSLYVQDDEVSQEDVVKKPDGQIKVTVKVAETVPKVTFKQTRKYNNFYTDDAGYGILTVTTADGTEVKDLELADPNAKTKCNFTLESRPEELSENTYYIVLREGEDEEIIDYKKNTKGVLRYRLEGYDSEESAYRTANITVSTENKKPTIVLSAKSDTLYPKVYYMNSFIRMTDKATGENIFNEEAGNEVRYVITSGKTKSYEDVPIVQKPDEEWDNHENDYEAKLNNSYYLWVDPWGGINSVLVEQPTYKTKADKFTLEIKKENWADWVSVPYSITVNTGNPKLVLGSSTVTLNKNSAVYQTQQAIVSLRLKGCQNHVDADEWNWVRFTGQDDKSKKVLSGDGSLTLDYWNWWDDNGHQYGDVVVRFNDNTVAAGTYKFKVETGKRDEQAFASATLTVKVVDTAVTKCLKITAKGSIDAMDRDGTSVTYTPKLSNLSGTVCDGHLEGPDADLFESYWDGSKLVVQARPGENYSTKLSYKVRPVFNVDAESYGGYEVDAGKDLAIKVKQGKPTLKATMVSNTIYRQMGNSAEIQLSAVFNKKPVEIGWVELVNYTDDFNWLDESDFYYDYGTGTETVRLSLINDDWPNDIIKSGTYKVKLRVIYREKAGNEKAAEVTCSIVVK